jgi:hypothetical protein
METQMKFRRAFESGLKVEFGDTVGEILGDIIGYFPRTGLDKAALTTMRDAYAIEIQSSISARRVDGGTLLLVRSNAIASALLEDTQGVQLWAATGQEWCIKVDGGGWNATAPEWDWLRENPEEYSRLVIELKRFLGQI